MWSIAMFISGYVNTVVTLSFAETYCGGFEALGKRETTSTYRACVGMFKWFPTKISRILCGRESRCDVSRYFLVLFYKRNRNSTRSK